MLAIAIVLDLCRMFSESLSCLSFWISSSLTRRKIHFQFYFSFYQCGSLAVLSVLAGRNFSHSFPTVRIIRNKAVNWKWVRTGFRAKGNMNSCKEACKNPGPNWTITVRFRCILPCQFKLYVHLLNAGQSRLGVTFFKTCMCRCTSTEPSCRYRSKGLK